MIEREWKGQTIDDMTFQLINEAFNACDGNIMQTARAVGMSRANLYRKLKEYGLHPRKTRIMGPPKTEVKRGKGDDFRSE